jgi:hypothetical protein
MPSISIKLALDRIQDQIDGVAIRKVLSDLRSSSLRLPSVDGVLMANSLHLVEDQHLFLMKLSSVAERFLIVEYERSRPSRWGPYPDGFERLRELFIEVGATRVEKLATRASRLWHQLLGRCRAVLITVLVGTVITIEITFQMPGSKW